MSKLVLTSTPVLTRNINTDVQLKCSVTSEPSASSRYAVTWLLQQQTENKTILSSDRDALLTFGPQLELSYRQRISMTRTEGPTFELSIRQAQISDKGSYTCEVVEWIQDTRSDWYKLPSVSTIIELTLIEPGKFLSLYLFFSYPISFQMPWKLNIFLSMHFSLGSVALNEYCWIVFCQSSQLNLIFKWDFTQNETKFQ